MDEADKLSYPQLIGSVNNVGGGVNIRKDLVLIDLL